MTIFLEETYSTRQVEWNMNRIFNLSLYCIPTSHSELATSKPRPLDTTIFCWNVIITPIVLASSERPETQEVRFLINLKSRDSWAEAPLITLSLIVYNTVIEGGYLGCQIQTYTTNGRLISVSNFTFISLYHRDVFFLIFYQNLPFYKPKTTVSISCSLECGRNWYPFRYLKRLLL